ncbi:ATPase component of ABC transporter [Labilithrix luteola]|uniref:Probable ATP-binding protein YbiT n=1 Tax=Labilithrix luteola TaxID=1391654 RepID=A0A0K1PQ47_9BACT|nr:ABC-F family ATP-binding cassette domain-containing protein [Labilithrix luteola]AKU95670.1 ATPase component of ABC transporter [Labilithrix luteola]
MIGLSRLEKSYGGRTLFDDVSLQLNAGSRYGLVGANGSGKSTLLKIIAKDEAPTSGAVTIPREARLGVLRQDRFLDDRAVILDLAMMGDTVVWEALCKQRRIVDNGADASDLADIEDVIRVHDGYTLEARASAVLDGLGIPLAIQKQPLSTLSGGFKLRVLLAQVLVAGPDVLLLDEPTNHLDILSIRWLETFLLDYEGCALVISHDQRFLEAIATHILDVDYGTVELYTGGYASFAVEKRATRERKEAEIARTQKIIADKRAFVDRFGAKASKAKQAQSRLKQIEKIEVEELVESSRAAPLFQFPIERPSGKEVLELTGITKAYGEKKVLKGVSLVIRRGERVAILGANGLGKSTLLKIVVRRLGADAGEVRWGYEARHGYFAQDHGDLLTDPKATPLGLMKAACPTEPEFVVRGRLGRVLFSGGEVNKRISTLSGGEAARLVFARIMAEKANVLILDEPTNHLDMESIEALAEGLKAYEGTLFFVSHDRAFVSALATRIVEVTEDGFRDRPGTYEGYLADAGDDHLDIDAVVLKAKKERRADTRSAKTRSDVRDETP